MILLSRFKVKNFKQFNELCLDFSDVRDYSFNKKCLTKNGRLLKTILVYGPNASGKSNLGLAIFDIVQHLVDKFTSQRAYQYYLNADHPEKAAEFEYVFKFSRYTITYKYAKISARSLVAESLESNGKLVFSWDSRTQAYDYTGLHDFGFATLNTNPEDRPISFLRYLANNSVLKEDSPVKLLMDFVEGMLWFRRCDDGNNFMGLLNSTQDIAEYFVQHGLVEDLERFLRSHDVDESVVAMDNPDGSKALYFQHKQLLPVFSVISSGTSALAVLFYWQQFFPKVSFLFMDEFDAFYHWGVAETILNDMISLDKQCVMTTHNTNLLDNKTIRPDCCFVIDKDGLSSLANRTDREIRQGNNLERLYLAGEFNG